MSINSDQTCCSNSNDTWAISQGIGARMKNLTGYFLVRSGVQLNALRLCVLQQLAVSSQVCPSFSDWLLLGQLRVAIEVNVRHCHQHRATRRHSLSHCDHCQSFRDYLHICLNIIAREAYSLCTPIIWRRKWQQLYLPKSLWSSKNQ
jgi:hypothetical protein